MFARLAVLSAVIALAGCALAPSPDAPRPLRKELLLDLRALIAENRGPGHDTLLPLGTDVEEVTISPDGDWVMVDFSADTDKVMLIIPDTSMTTPLWCGV